MSCRYGPKAGRSSRLAIVNSPMTMAKVRKAPLSTATRTFGKITRKRIGAPAGAEALGGLGQRAHVDRAQAGVHRAVHVRERQGDVAEHQQPVGPPRRARQRHTNELYAMAQRPPCKGGVQGVGPLISTHAVCIPILAGYSDVTFHIDHCIVAEGNKTAERMEEKYGMDKSERRRAFDAALPLVPELKTKQEVEEAGCGMGRDYSQSKGRYLDTYFYGQNIYHRKEDGIFAIDDRGKESKCGLARSYCEWMEGSGKVPVRKVQWWNNSGSFDHEEYPGEVIFTVDGRGVKSDGEGVYTLVSG